MIKKIVTVFALLAAISVAMPVLAKAHSVTIGFTKSSDDVGAAGSGYVVFRANGSCPVSVTTTAGFTALNTTPFQGNSFIDTTPGVGNFCYFATFNSGGAASGPSNTAGVSILPAAPSNVVIIGSN